jgi:ketosteroid isomerase-like protein
MRSSCLALVTLVAVAACTTQQARRADTATPATATLAGTPAVDAAAVRQAIEATNARFIGAVLRGDTAGIADGYASDAILMMPNEKLLTGHDAIAKTLVGMMSSMKFTAFAGHTQDVVATGDYAIETGTYDMTTQAKGAKPVHDVGKYLTVWKKQPDGSYRVVRDIMNSDLPAK